jgi:hypothetical protein
MQNLTDLLFGKPLLHAFLHPVRESVKARI